VSSGSKNRLAVETLDPLAPHGTMAWATELGGLGSHGWAHETLVVMSPARLLALRFEHRFWADFPESSPHSSSAHTQFRSSMRCTE
jgi:hypothetical protein